MNKPVIEREMNVESSTVALLNKSEIDQQIATAHKYPRSIQKFLDNSLEMVTLSENIAQECIYSIPRDGKVIEGPSARFAEVVFSAWGNSRAGARIVNDDGQFLSAQGVFHDLERNTAVTFEVQRRIVDKLGRRFSADMVGVTANAACSIALRNAILKGIPKAFWSDIYLAARKTVMGDFKTLANKRASRFDAFQAFGISKQQVCKLLAVAGTEDIGLEHLVTLGGILTALKEGDTTPEELLNPHSTPPSPPPAPESSQTIQSGPSPPPVIEAVTTIEAAPIEEAGPQPMATMTYDERIADWESRLKAADTAIQEEIFETEIEAFKEKGEIFPPDYNRLISLVKSA